MIPQKIKKAVIPVAGLGTRFLPATKSIPKEMFPIVDKPSIQYIVEEALASGIEHIIFVNAHGKQAIEDHFDTNLELEMILSTRKKERLLEEIRTLNNMGNIVTVRQKSPLGLGHAILSAERMIGDEPFAVLLGDDLVDSDPPCLQQLLEVFHRKQSPVVALMNVESSLTHLYGIVGTQETPSVTDKLYELTSFSEKPHPEEAPSNLAIVGRYILTPDIFECLKKIRPGQGGEIQLTDALQRLLDIRSIFGYCYEGKRLDVGDKLGFVCANIHFGLKRPEFREDLLSFIHEELNKNVVS